MLKVNNKSNIWHVKESKVHGKGVFANRSIRKGERIIQYIGEKITKSEGDRRSANRIKKYLTSSKTGSVYIFELNICCHPQLGFQD